MASLKRLTFHISRGRQDEECVFNELPITTHTDLHNILLSYIFLLQDKIITFKSLIIFFF